jgi:hypothetical protein
LPSLSASIQIAPEMAHGAVSFGSPCSTGGRGIDRERRVGGERPARVRLNRDRLLDGLGIRESGAAKEQALDLHPRCVLDVHGDLHARPARDAADPDPVRSDSHEGAVREDDIATLAHAAHEIRAPLARPPRARTVIEDAHVGAWVARFVPDDSVRVRVGGRGDGVLRAEKREKILEDPLARLDIMAVPHLERVELRIVSGVGALTGARVEVVLVEVPDEPGAWVVDLYDVRLADLSKLGEDLLRGAVANVGRTSAWELGVRGEA